MPKISIPSLPPDIRQFGSCIIFDEEIEELMVWVQSHQKRSVSHFQEDGEDRWLSLALDACDDEDHVHFHVEIARIDLRNSKDEQLCDHNELLTLIDDFLEQAAEIEAVAQMRGRFRIARRDIPENGIIGSLLSFKKKSCGAPFALKGAKLEVDHEWFTTLDFNYDDESEEVRAQLWGIAGMELDHEYLKELLEIMATGADCFIFERVSKEASA